MNTPDLTPEEFELHLQDLVQRLEAFLDGQGGDPDRLLDLAEELLSISERYPAVYERYHRIEGLIGETLARRTQQHFMPDTTGTTEQRGCLLGWLLGRQKNS